MIVKLLPIFAGCLSSVISVGSHNQFLRNEMLRVASNDFDIGEVSGKPDTGRMVHLRGVEMSLLEGLSRTPRFAEKEPTLANLDDAAIDAVVKVLRELRDTIRDHTKWYFVEGLKSNNAGELLDIAGVAEKMTNSLSGGVIGFHDRSQGQQNKELMEARYSVAFAVALVRAKENGATHPWNYAWRTQSINSCEKANNAKKCWLAVGKRLKKALEIEGSKLEWFTEEELEKAREFMHSTIPEWCSLFDELGRNPSSHAGSFIFRKMGSLEYSSSAPKASTGLQGTFRRSSKARRGEVSCSFCSSCFSW